MRPPAQRSLAREAAHRGLGKAREVLDLGKLRQLAANRLDRVGHREAAPEQDAVGALQGAARRGGEAAALEPDRVDAAEPRRVPGDLDVGLGAGVLEVLRRSADHGAVVDAAAAPHARPPRDERVAADARPLADPHVRTHDRAGLDHHPRAQLGRGVHERRGMDRDSHGRLGTIVASSSASATSWSSTNACPRIFDVPALILSSVSRKRSWSPGTTGRRKRAPSMPMKYMSLSFGSSTELSSRSPPTCAMASMISTAGMMGWPGKCPSKNGSLIVTFLMPSIHWPSSRWVMRSMSRNG